MERDGSAVESPDRETVLPGYERLDGEVPVLHAPRLTERAREVRGHLAHGSDALADILGVETPRRVVETPRQGVSTVQALVVADEDWPDTPRGNEHPYPPGLPYFTRSADPPVLVFPEKLAPVFRPRTGATLPLAVWHELAHAFLLQQDVVRTPAWLGELAPQAASAAVARRVGLPLGEHLGLVDRRPGFTIRGFGGRASAADQMSFQNLLLVLGAEALEEFGEDFLGRLFRALWEEEDLVEEKRAEELLAGALGPDGHEWLSSRPEF